MVRRRPRRAAARPGGRGSGLGGDELSVDAHGLIRQLRAARRSCWGSRGVRRPGRRDRSAEARDEGPGPGPGGDETGARVGVSHRVDGYPHRLRSSAPTHRLPSHAPAPKDGDDDLDALLPEPDRRIRRPQSAWLSEHDVTTSWTICWDIHRGGGRRGSGGAGRGSSATAAARTDDDDAFLDELLG